MSRWDENTLPLAWAILSVALLSPFAAGQTFAKHEAHSKAIEEAYGDWLDATNAKDLTR